MKWHGWVAAWFIPALAHAAEVTLTLAPVNVPAGITLTRAAVLVSGVAFVRPDGSFREMDAQYGAVDLAGGNASFVVRGVPDGPYQGIQFFVGVRPEINHADVGLWPAGHPLNPLVNGLHWGWQGGYVFMALEGRYPREGGELGGWSFHLATDANLMTVRVPARIEISEDCELTLGFDVGRVFRGVTLAADHDSTHSGRGDELAALLAQNVAAAFSLRSNAAVASRSLRRGSAPTESGPSDRESGATPFAFEVPSGWPQPALPSDNPLTVEGVELGRRLFVDRRLSLRGAQSCASCHDPVHAFSDSVAFSAGADGKPGGRNAPSLCNLAWQPAYAWDGGKARIRDQALAAMTNPVEMHSNAPRVAATLAADPATVARFAAAFGSPEVTPERIGLALEQYLLTLVSADSTFDRAVRGIAPLTEIEKEGFALFVTESDPARGRHGADCFHCHGGALFSDFGYKNNGLDLVSVDAGRERITSRISDEAKFKTPSLRNVALTAPYMHDGRFATLEAVVAHYDHGVKRTATLDPNLAKHPDAGLSLTADEQRALVAFLRTLTDARWTPPPALRPSAPLASR